MQTSNLSRKTRLVPVERGELWGSVYSSITTRRTEVDGIDRAAYGERIAATNNARYDAECLQCSICRSKKHYTEFNRDSRMTWRRQRRYECKVCEKLQGIDRQAKRVSRSVRM